MTRKDLFLYILLATGCTAGYIWLWVAGDDPNNESTVCLFKNVTSMPCPSCGSTRAVVALAEGDFMGAFQWNPIGFIIALVLVISPLWIASDLLARRRTLPGFIERAENWLQNPWVYAPAIILILANWLWTFSKGL